jgi:hypothetical protein
VFVQFVTPSVCAENGGGKFLCNLGNHNPEDHNLPAISLLSHYQKFPNSALNIRVSHIFVVSKAKKIAPLKI